MIGGEAVVTLLKQFMPVLTPILDSVHLGHSHTHTHGLGPNINAAWLAGGSILVKEALYRATMKVATEKRSSLLASNAYHHRVDSLTALVALVSICCSHFFTNATWLDPVGGLLISAMIIQAGWANTRSALLELADVNVDSQIRTKVSDAVTAVAQDVELVDTRAIKSGQNLLVDIALSAPGSWPLHQLQTVEHEVRQSVSSKVRGVKKVSVRFISNDVQADSKQIAAGSEFVAFDKDVAVDAHSDDEHDHQQGHGHKHKTK